MGALQLLTGNPSEKWMSAECPGLGWLFPQQTLLLW